MTQVRRFWLLPIGSQLYDKSQSMRGRDGKTLIEASSLAYLIEARSDAPLNGIGCGYALQLFHGYYA